MVLAALAAGTVVAQSGLSRLAAARGDMAAARLRLTQAGDQLAAAERRAQWVDAASKAVAQSRRLGLDPAGWVERKVSLRAVSVARADAERLLRDAAPGAGRLFVADAFEVSVLDAHAGLFDAPGADDHGLSLTLRGSYFARDMEKQ